MATAAPALNPEAAFPIKEDSIFWQALSGIPVIGLGISHIQQASLAEQVFTVPNIPSLIKVIEVKNDYKIGTIIGGFTTTALVIAGVASDILAVGFLIAPVITLTSMGLTIYEIHMNNQAIYQLQNRGNITPDILVH